MTGEVPRRRARLPRRAFHAELEAQLVACLPAKPEPEFSASAFDELERCLWRLEERPWTKADIALHTGGSTQRVRRSRARLRTACKDLQQTLKELDQRAIFQSVPGEQAQARQLYAAAVLALQAVLALGPVTMTGPDWGDFFGRYKRYTPANVTIRQIGGLTLAVLRSADERAGRKPRRRLQGAAIAFVLRRLDACLPDKDLPDYENILRTLRQISAAVDTKS